MGRGRGCRRRGAGRGRGGPGTRACGWWQPRRGPDTRRRTRDIKGTDEASPTPLTALDVQGVAGRGPAWPWPVIRPRKQACTGPDPPEKQGQLPDLSDLPAPSPARETAQTLRSRQPSDRGHRAGGGMAGVTGVDAPASDDLPRQ